MNTSPERFGRYVVSVMTDHQLTAAKSWPSVQEL
jgi:hypothetical protein